jgi:mycothione reductase
MVPNVVRSMPLQQRSVAHIGHDVRVTHYDLALIGTGSGNTVVDKRFSDRSVAIIEENLFGGTCLNVGCIPTKMFVHPADLARSAPHAQRLGVDLEYDGARWPEIRDRIFGRVDGIQERGRHYRHSLDYVDVYESHCTFVDDHTLVMHDEQGSRIEADQIVIAAGSRVAVAPLPGLTEVARATGVVHTSDTVMRLPDLPRRMVIVGGGFVSAEFAHVFSALGTEVTVVHRGDSLVPQEDETVSATFTRIAATQWDLRLATVVTGVEASARGAVVSLSDGDEIEVDVLLMATGRVPNADRLGLEKTGIEVRDGIVVVDEYQRTTVDGVWALGDVANTWELKHVANAEARVVRHNLLFPHEMVAADHRFVPSAVFTSPQIARVGLTAQDARRRGIAAREVVHDYAQVAYGWAMEVVAGDAFVKLVGDEDGQHLLGAHIIGPEASNLIQPLIQGMSLGSPVHDIAHGQYWIHPAMAEVVENALLKMIR